MYLLLSVIALLMYTNPIAALLIVFYEKDGGGGTLVIPLEDRKTDLIHLRASMPQELLCYLLR